MADYRYVTRAETKEAHDDVVSIIHEVQDIVRKYFTFQYKFIGSYARNMVTYDADSNVGYDFDVNFDVYDPDEEYTPEEIRTRIFDALQEVAPKYGYQKIENSTSVITIKMVDYWNSIVCHSCDFAVINDCDDGQQQYIRLNKKPYTYYSWEYRCQGYAQQPQKIRWLKENGYWGETRNYYIEKKNNNNNPNKHSRTIFAETINEMCQKKGYSEE